MRDQPYVKGAYSLDTKKNTADVKWSSAGGAQNRFKRKKNTVAVDYCAFTAGNPRTADKNTCGEYKKEALFQNKMRIEKCDS